MRFVKLALFAVLVLAVFVTGNVHAASLEEVSEPSQGYTHNIYPLMKYTSDEIAYGEYSCDMNGSGTYGGLYLQDSILVYWVPNQNSGLLDTTKENI